MSTTVDDVGRETEDSGGQTPDLPNSLKSDRVYPEYIVNWITLIQNNDPLIYSQWDNYTPYIGDEFDYDDSLVLGNILRGSYKTRSPYHVTEEERRLPVLIKELKDGTRDILSVRKDLMNMMVEMYYDLNDNVPKKRVTRDMYKMFFRVNSSGNNPFDILYYFTCLHKSRGCKDSLWELLVVIIPLLIFLLMMWDVMKG